jgi:hypothetical protein
MQTISTDDQKCGELEQDLNHGPIFSPIPRQSFPLRGLAWSLVVHELLFLAAVVVPWSYWLPPETPEIHYQVTLISPEPDKPISLPTLLPPVSDSAAPAASDAASASSHDKTIAASFSGALPSKKSSDANPSPHPIHAVVHQGPQRIISNPPKPDNYVQTIRQTELVKAPHLPMVLPLPNIVELRRGEPVLSPPSLREMPLARLASAAIPVPADAVVPPPVDPALLKTNPALPAPAAALPPPPDKQAVKPPAKPKEASQPELTNTQPTTAAAEKPKTQIPSATKPVLGSEEGTSGRNLLVLNADPFAGKVHGAAPPGELSGAFVVSPIPLPDSPVPGTGSGVAAPETGSGLHGSRPGSKSDHGIPGPGLSTGHGSGSGNGPSQQNGGGKATRSGTNGRGQGQSADKAPGAGGGGQGKGNGASKNHGSGRTGLGTGGTGNEIAGNGGPASPFAGMTISGGDSHPAIRAATEPLHRQEYGITIISTGNSGGGLKDYGVFRNEAVYTIYVDMSDAGNWTLQYSVLPDPGDSAYANVGQVISPPYPEEKHVPQFSPELAIRYDGTLLVIQGVIAKDGSVQNLRSIQTPDPMLMAALSESLKASKFHPAEAGNKAVAIKFLLGVPVRQQSSVLHIK